MKLNEYRQVLQQDPEYLAIEKELGPLLDFADRVLELRLKKGWSQSELARRVGTRQANISRLESGVGNPTLKFLQKVAGAFDGELSIRITLSGGDSMDKETRSPCTVSDNPILVPD